MLVHVRISTEETTSNGVNQSQFAVSSSSRNCQTYSLRNVQPIKELNSQFVTCCTENRFCNLWSV